MFRGTQEHPPTPFKHPNHAFDKNDDCQAMPKSYSGDNPEFSKLVRTFVSPGCGVEVLSALNLPNAAERHTSWLLARKEERGPSLPLNPPHPARQRPFFETSSLPTSTRLFQGRASKRHVDTAPGSEHGSNSFRLHASRPRPRPRPRPRHQARIPRLKLASASICTSSAPFPTDAAPRNTAPGTRLASLGRSPSPSACGLGRCSLLSNGTDSSAGLAPLS